MSSLSDRLASLSPAQRALLEKRLAAKAQAPSASFENAKAEPIAIVGMACRLPGASTLDEYWRVIRDGVDTTSETPPDRWDVDALHDPTGQQRGKLNTRRGGFVENIDKFDPQFFGITPREANRMDPQQRLLLEVAWEAFENAGLPPKQMAGSKTGVYVGIGGNDYSKTPFHRTADYLGVIDGYMGTGNALSIAANRVSYILDLRGPSLAVDTACSSSSVAVHLAVESLRRGECDAALAGGVNAILTPETSIAFSDAKMLSPDGHCRPFDSRANGYVRGEGCGLVLLKRLADAQRDGDDVLAVLRATSVNQDGRTSGISAPNGESQKQCLRAAHEQAGVTADEVGYIEAHGTGTPLGDPIEMQALAEVFASQTKAEPNTAPVRVTSVKANIGHTETVSGVAGLIKTVLMLRHGEFAPQTHLQTLNPHIKLEGSRLQIPREVTPWTERRLAGVSSFGFGGTNTHLLVSAAEQSVGAAATDENLPATHLLKLSGKTPEAITEQARRLTDHLARSEDSAAEVAFVMNTGRCDFSHRAAIVASDREKLVATLASLAEGRPTPSIRVGEQKGFQRRRVAMLFSGQGAQQIGMGADLMSYPPYREAIERCAAVFDDLLEAPLADVLAGKGPAGSGEGRNGHADAAAWIDQTRYTQPALFAVEYALSQLWASIGVTPDFVAGHSIGEYVAAVVADVMDVEDAARLVAARGRLMQSAPAGGKMVALFANEQVVATAIEGHSGLSIAAINSPGNTVISGEAAAVDMVVQQLANQGIEGRELRVSHAFHSPMMDSILDEFEQAATKIEYRKPRIAMASNLTGGLHSVAPTAKYWRNHLRSAVRFSDNLTALGEAGAVEFVEAGPGATLLGLGKRTLTAADGLAWLPSIRKGQPDVTVFAGSVAEHYVTGGAVDWRKWHAVTGGGCGRRILAPNYPFDRKSCWLEFDKPGRRRVTSATADHPLLGSRVPTPWASRVYEATLGAGMPAYLADHVVQGSVVTPAAAYLEQSLAAAEQLFGEGTHTVADLRIGQAMFLSQDNRPVQVTLSPESGGVSQLEVYSPDAKGESNDDQSEWLLHASSRLQHGAKDDGLSSTSIDTRAWSEASITHHAENEFYESAAKVGFHYGPRFQVLPQVETHPNDQGGVEAFSELSLAEDVRAEIPLYRLHPVLGDACLQALACAITGDAKQRGHMPIGIERVRVLRKIESSETLRVFARREPYDGDQGEAVRGDAWLLGADGSVIAELSGIQLQALSMAGGTSADPADWLYQMQWSGAPIAESVSKPVTGGWLLLTDETGVAERVGEKIEAAGGSVLLVRRGAQYAVQIDESRRWTEVTIDPTDAEQFHKLLTMATANPAAALAGVVATWPLSAEPDSNPGSPDAEAITAESLLLLQQMQRLTAPPARGVWFVTAGAQTGEGLSTATVAVDQAAVVGFGRVARVEAADLKPRLVDLDPTTDVAEQAEALLAELAATDDEDQIAYRGSDRYAARLAAASELLEPAGEQGKTAVPTRGAYQLRIAKPGTLEALRYETIAELAPGKGEVTFEVHAAALNFSDVLKTLGLYPGVRDAVVPLGIEASGVVTAVGEDVKRFKIGDQVMGVAPYAFASHARTPEYTLAPKPDTITHAQAAALPIAFMTAYHGLVNLAQIEPGERVLIHAGAGGVGLAAIQIAHHAGAQVFATAGSDEKRDYLRSLGIEHVFSSRTLDFADQVLAATDREGVDIVLNSLPGEAIPKSFAVLRAYGRFLEIGKTDIYQDRKIGLLPFQDNLSYHAIDLDRVLRQRPAYVRRLLGDVLERFAAGDYTPTRQTNFPADETVAAFRYMQQRKNIGKIVVTKKESESGKAEDTTDAGSSIHSDGAYLITGGRGALGLRLAEWLTEQGAGAVVLLSRGEPTGDAAKRIEQLRARGVRVEIAQGDVTDTENLRRALNTLPTDLPPLRGVIHAAGVLADGMLADMSREQLAKAMRPKTIGAWNLHQATKPENNHGEPLDFFVLFSSVAAVLGSPGQANYAAGNAVLDALAHARHAAGLPATVINWGPWADGGMATADGQADSIESRGMALLPPEPSLDLLGRLIRSGATQAMVADARWGAMSQSLGARRPAALSDLLGATDEGTAVVSQTDLALRKELSEATPEIRAAMLLELVQNELARVMAVEPDGLDVDKPLADYGLDSLMSLELKNSVEARLGVTLPMSKLLDGPSIRSLAEALGEQIASARGDDEEFVDDAWRPLTELKPGEGPPLFLLPTLGGDVQCYREFVAAWPEGTPIVAFRPRGLSDTAPPHDTMDEMVADYVAAIRLKQPEGPYHLAAWSTGGIPAVAVAERLEAEGAQVARVALFDTPHPRAYHGVEVDNDLQFLCDTMRFAAKVAGNDASLSVEQFDGLPEEERFGMALAEAKRQGVISGDADEPFVRRLVKIGEGLIRACAEYQPGPLQAPVTLFRPADEGHLAEVTGVAESADHGWADDLTATPENVTVPGDHFSMMAGDGATRLAAEVAARFGTGDQ